MDTATNYLLIVEDDPDILKLLDATLTFKGYRVITARNGREGLEAMQVNRPAIVVADIMMPQLDGFGLVHRMRLNPQTRDIPVVIITATYVAREDRDFALSIGATRFLEKPIELDKFLKIIAEILEQRLPAIPQSFNEIDFYNEYRRRLEAKLAEKGKQIAREEHLLKTGANKEDSALQASLRQAIRDRRELQLLIAQVHEQLENYARPE
jgi:DNA-binding response OmpR family regulator